MLNYFDPAPAPAKGAPLSAEAQAELNARYAEQLAANVAKAEKIDLLADTLRKKWGLTAPIKKSKVTKWGWASYHFTLHKLDEMKSVCETNSQTDELDSVCEFPKKKLYSMLVFFPLCVFRVIV